MRNYNGFTFIELVVTMGIFVLLMMIGSFNLIPVKQKVSLSTTIQTLITDIKEQQLKAMSGETSQGIYFDPDNINYYVFKGTTYESNNDTNFKVALGDQIEVTTIDFSGRQLIFAPVSGEISNFQPDNKIVLENTSSNEQRTIFFNKYGTIIDVQ